MKAYIIVIYSRSLYHDNYTKVISLSSPFYDNQTRVIFFRFIALYQKYQSNCFIFTLLNNDIQIISISSFVHNNHVRGTLSSLYHHDDIIKWKHFSCYWPFVRGIHRSPVNSPHKGQCRRALMFSLICVWINGWVNNREAGDLRCHHAHYDVIVMITIAQKTITTLETIIFWQSYQSYLFEFIVS